MATAAHYPIGAAIRPGHVVRLDDIDADALSDLADAISPDIPVILNYRGPDDMTSRNVAEEILDSVEEILIALFPRWLPDAPVGELIDVADATASARELCVELGTTGSVIVDLARAAASRTTTRHTGKVSELRAAALFTLLRHAYARPEVALAVRAATELSVPAQRSTAAACEWLAQHGAITVWLTADALPAVTRVPSIRLTLGHQETARPADSLPPAVTSQEQFTRTPVMTVTRPVGSPAPHSEAEQRLERALSRCGWAHERVWNRSPAGLDALASVIVVDLMWPQALVVVEIDGPDHRRPVKYASDRSRDNMLQRRGFLVLRYTNEQILSDVSVVVDELAHVIAQRSQGTQNQRSVPSAITSANTEGAVQWTTRS